MDIDLVKDPRKFHGLRAEWNHLLSTSASDVPFLRHEYLTSWWETRGGGEWAGGKLAILAGRDPGGDLLGLAPLFLHENTLLLLGSEEVSDFLDFIAPGSHLERFTSRAVEFLAQEQAGLPWQKIELLNILESSPTLAVLENAVQDQDWKYQVSRLQPAPCLKLPASWDSYLSALEDRYRGEIERKLRRAEQYFLPVDWYKVKGGQHLEEEMSAFLELMAYHPEKAEFLTEQMRSHMMGTAHQAYQHGWGQLSFLTVGDLKAAAYFSFDYGDRIWIYNSGIHPMFENLSPGWVLLAYLIRQGINEGKTAVDFMRGDEAYKYHFGGDNRYVTRVEISR